MTAKGFGWVGVSDPEAPPLQSALNWVRRRDFERWIRALALQPDVTIWPTSVLGVTGWIKNNPDIIAYFATGHGDPSYAQLNPVTRILPSDIKWALEDRAPMKFSFITHSEAMREVTAGTWAYELRKGQSGTAVVGVKNSMSFSDWTFFWLHWANEFFTYAGLGFTFKRAFDAANFSYPDFLENDKVAFAGDWAVSKKDLA